MNQVHDHLDEFGDLNEEGLRDEGWSEDEDFDYDEFVKENFSEHLTNTETKPLWRIVAIGLLVLMFFFVVLQVYEAASTP